MRIATNTPVDKTAVLVTSKGPNESVKQFRQACRVGVMSYTTPRALKEPPQTIKNYIGYKFGDMIVTGFLGIKRIRNGRKKNGGMRFGNQSIWEARCACGKYEARSSRVLNKTKQPHRLTIYSCLICTNKRHEERNDIIDLWRPI